MMCGMAYPVSIEVERQIANRNRLTVAFRLILAIPHFLVGGLGVGFALSGSRSDLNTSVGETGFLGAVAYVLAIVSSFTIVIGGSHITAIRQHTTFYLRWRVRALAYLMLLEDSYPPFGDAAYPASLTFVDVERPRSRLTVDSAHPDHPARDCDRTAQHRLVGDVVRVVVRDPDHRQLSTGAVRLRRRRAALVHPRRGVPAPARGRIPTILI